MRISTAFAVAVVELTIWYILCCLQTSTQLDSRESIYVWQYLTSWLLLPHLHLAGFALFFSWSVAGLLVAITLYYHLVENVFNSKPPPIWHNPSIFVNFLKFINPMEIVWRLVTFKLRVLPDWFVNMSTLMHKSLCMYAQTLDFLVIIACRPFSHLAICLTVFIYFHVCQCSLALILYIFFPGILLVKLDVERLLFVSNFELIYVVPTDHSLFGIFHLQKTKRYVDEKIYQFIRIFESKIQNQKNCRYEWLNRVREKLNVKV